MGGSRWQPRGLRALLLPAARQLLAGSIAGEGFDKQQLQDPLVCQHLGQQVLPFGVAQGRLSTGAGHCRSWPRADGRWTAARDSGRWSAAGCHLAFKLPAAQGKGTADAGLLLGAAAVGATWPSSCLQRKESGQQACRHNGRGQQGRGLTPRLDSLRDLCRLCTVCFLMVCHFVPEAETGNHGSCSCSTPVCLTSCALWPALCLR